LEDTNPGFCVKLRVFYDSGHQGGHYEPAVVHGLRDYQKGYMEYFYDYDKSEIDMQREQAISIDSSTNKRGTRGAMITQKIPDEEQYQRIIRKRYPSLYDDTIEKKHYFDNNKASIVDKPFPGVSLEYIGAGSPDSFYLGTKTDVANDIVTLQAVIKDIDDWKPESELAKEEKETLLVKYTNVKTRWYAELKDIKEAGCPFSMNTIVMMPPSS
jgi:hypothetical protein